MQLTVSPSPHINSNKSTQKTMLFVILALMPAVFVSGVVFGAKAIILIAVSSIFSVLFEYISRIAMKRANTISDLSAVVTGLILALNVPCTLPIWMLIIGDFIAIVIVKQLFGGLGQNFANPAIVGRIFLLVSFTGPMIEWVKPFYYKLADTDTITMATPLVEAGRENNPFSYMDLFLGNIPGSLGEISALALLIGGFFLIFTKVISPILPFTFIATVALGSLVCGQDPLYQILSGGLFLGAFFMATDYVTSPITSKGKLIFGVGCGIITCVIRFYANLPEGVSYSILIMNILTPYIDMATKKTYFGKKQPEKKEVEAK